MIDFLNSLPQWLKVLFAILVGFGVPIGIVVESIIEYIASGRQARLHVFCVVLAIAITAAWSYLYFSSHNIWDETVYTTNSGDCYHISGCKHLHSRHKTTIAQAWEDGFYQCSFCNPNFWAWANHVIPRAIAASLFCFWLYMFLDWKSVKPKDS